MVLLLIKTQGREGKPVYLKQTNRGAGLVPLTITCLLVLVVKYRNMGFAAADDGQDWNEPVWNPLWHPWDCMLFARVKMINQWIVWWVSMVSIVDKAQDDDSIWKDPDCPAGFVSMGMILVDRFIGESCAEPVWNGSETFRTTPWLVWWWLAARCALRTSMRCPTDSVVTSCSQCRCGAGHTSEQCSKTLFVDDDVGSNCPQNWLGIPRKGSGRIENQSPRGWNWIEWRNQRKRSYACLLDIQALPSFLCCLHT